MTARASLLSPLGVIACVALGSLGSGALVALAALGALAACSAPAPDARYTQTTLPDSASFPPVAQLLELRCGSIDCHGTPYRNLRIYGSTGLRFSPTDRPLVPTCSTADEIAQDYLSVVGLEPETMSAVAAGGDPSLLTMVRKARGTEAHKGGAIWTQGDDSDNCLVTWLHGQADSAACDRAVTALLPSGRSNPLARCLSSP
jgi:hypothetical protein